MGKAVTHVNMYISFAPPRGVALAVENRLFEACAEDQRTGLNLRGGAIVGVMQVELKTDAYR
jgi:uncharacterized membrane protein